MICTLIHSQFLCTLSKYLRDADVLVIRYTWVCGESGYEDVLVVMED